MIRWSAFFTASFLVFSCAGSEGGSKNEGDAPPGWGENFLLNLVDNIVIPRAQSFKEKASILKTRVDDYCQSPQGTMEQKASLKEAKLAYVATMKEWQHLELMQFGPLKENSRQVKNAIYAFPVRSNLCKIRQNGPLADGPLFSLTDAPVEEKGLGALSYLLYGDESLDSCSQAYQADYGLLKGDGFQNSCSYMLSIASDIEEQADDLVKKWDIQRDGFVSGRLYNGTKNTLIEVLDALFYLDEKVKDIKIGQPAGIDRERCQEGSCPALVEFPIAQISKEAILANVSAFQEIVTGDSQSQDGFGFVEVLEGLGSKASSDQVVEDLAAFLANMKSEAVGELSLKELSEDIVPNRCQATSSQLRFVELCALYQDLKKVTDWLKEDFLKIIEFELPHRGNKDGD